MLTAKKKANVIKGAARHESDTGSADVQVALLSKRIDELTKHLKKNAKDNHSRRGLLKMVSQRRTLLDYLRRNDTFNLTFNLPGYGGAASCMCPR